MRSGWLFLFIFPILTACGGVLQYEHDVTTQAPPTVIRIEPIQGPPGTTVTIYGFGFSFIPQNNIISIGEWSAVAENYTLLDNTGSAEIESISFRVPDAIKTGDYSIIVVVHDNVSNANITFTVTAD